MNLGAGRIVYQDLVKISKAIGDKNVEKNPVLVEALTYAQDQGKNVHFLGLLSNGGGTRTFGSSGRPLGDVNKI